MRPALGFLLVLGLAATPLTAQSGPDAASLALARRLLTAMRGVEVIDSSMSRMIAMQRQSPTGLPPVFWDSLEVRFRREMPRLVDEVAVIYLRHYTKAEIEQLLAFYGTPLGRKVAQVNGPVTQESMAAGQAWGAQIGQQLAGEMQEKGLLGR